MRPLPSARISAVLAILALAPAGPLVAQQVISARSGVVQYVEGDATLGGEALNPKAGEFPAMKKGDVLQTTDMGRAEVLLTPGVFLRVGEKSSVRMVANSLADTQLEFLSGEALVECDDILKDNAVSVLHNGTKVSLQKNGLYRFDGAPARVGVYSGEARVTSADGKTVTVKGGHEATLEGEVAVAGFNSKVAEDSLFRWSSTRSNYISMANVSAAHEIQDSGSYWGTNLWAFNSAYGMYTYVPFGTSMFGPFGYGFFNPYDAASFYTMYPMYYGYGSGYYYPGRAVRGGGGSSSGVSRAIGRTHVPLTSRQMGYASAARRAPVSRTSLAPMTSGRFSGFSAAGRSSGGFSTTTAGRGGFSGAHSSAAPSFSGSSSGMSAGGHAAGGGGGGGRTR